MEGIKKKNNMGLSVGSSNEEESIKIKSNETFNHKHLGKDRSYTTSGNAFVANSKLKRNIDFLNAHIALTSQLAKAISRYPKSYKTKL